jgi:hypothetical protein
VLLIIIVELCVVHLFTIFNHNYAGQGRSWRIGITLQPLDILILNFYAGTYKYKMLRKCHRTKLLSKYLAQWLESF